MPRCVCVDHIIIIMCLFHLHNVCVLVGLCDDVG